MDNIQQTHSLLHVIIIIGSILVMGAALRSRREASSSPVVLGITAVFMVMIAVYAGV